MAEQPLGEKRQRYELLPPRQPKPDHGRSITSLLNENSGQEEVRQFEADVLRRFNQLMASEAPRQNYSNNTGEKGAQGTLTSSHAAPSIESLNARYRRLVKIGEGSFGEVFIVYDTVTGTYLTMKRMFKLLQRGTGRSLVGLHNTTFRELQLLSALRHPNIVALVDYHVLADGSLIVFMPVVAHDFGVLMRHWGRTLVDSNSSSSGGASRMPLPIAKCLFRQLLEGVAYLHRHKVVHRDLKPSNLMLTAEGVLKIIDFGWARYLAGDRHTRMTGPPCVVTYRPPEVLIGGPAATRYTFAIDVWCCGCILFEMLTGGTPFVKTRNEAEALASIVDWLGSPSPSSAVYVGKKGKVTELPRGRSSSFRTRCAAVNIAEREIDFLSRLLVLEPDARSLSKDLLLDDWFTTAPAACVPPDIPLPAGNTYRFLDHQRRRLRH